MEHGGKERALHLHVHQESLLEGLDVFHINPVNRRGRPHDRGDDAVVQGQVGLVVSEADVRNARGAEGGNVAAAIIDGAESGRVEEVSGEGDGRRAYRGVVLGLVIRPFRSQGTNERGQPTMTTCTMDLVNDEVIFPWQMTYIG